jgi:hypothetical protein
MGCQRRCLDMLLRVEEEVLTASADDDYTRSHVCGYLKEKGG